MHGMARQIANSIGLFALEGRMGERHDEEEALVAHTLIAGPMVEPAVNLAPSCTPVPLHITERE